MRTTILRSCLTAGVTALVLTAGCGTASTHASTRLSSTPTQAAANTPAWPGTVCGNLKDSSDHEVSVQVSVLTGRVSCRQALRVVDTYYHEPPGALQGSAGYATIGPWTCSTWPGAVYASTGHAGYCETKAGLAAISMDKPGVRPQPIPTTWP